MSYLNFIISILRSNLHLKIKSERLSVHQQINGQWIFQQTTEVVPSFAGYNNFPHCLWKLFFCPTHDAQIFTPLALVLPLFFYPFCTYFTLLILFFLLSFPFLPFYFKFFSTFPVLKVPLPIKKLTSGDTPSPRLGGGGGIFHYMNQCAIFLSVAILLQLFKL